MTRDYAIGGEDDIVEQGSNTVDETAPVSRARKFACKNSWNTVGSYLAASSHTSDSFISDCPTILHTA